MNSQSSARPAPPAFQDASPLPENDEMLKACCAAIYESDWSRLLLGDSFHPGGITLTRRLGSLLALTPHDTVLDVASGQGTSALVLAREFGCRVIGLDFGAEAVAKASVAAAAAGLAHLVQFRQGDAEKLPFAPNSFTAALCECAFCTFPNKPAAATELARVLAPGGRLGLSDLTRQGGLSPELNTLLAWVACIADAQPLAAYAGYLAAAGFIVDHSEKHDHHLAQTVRQVRQRLLGAQLLLTIKQIALPGANFQQAQAIARSAGESVKQGRLGYALLTAHKPR